MNGKLIMSMRPGVSADNMYSGIMVSASRLLAEKSKKTTSTLAQFVTGARKFLVMLHVPSLKSFSSGKKRFRVFRFSRKKRSVSTRFAVTLNNSVNG